MPPKKNERYSNVDIEILNYGNLSRWHCCCLGRTHFLKLEPFTLHNQRAALLRSHHKSFEHRSTLIFPESAIDENSTGPSVLKSGPFGVGILFNIVSCDVLSFLRKRHRATNSFFIILGLRVELSTNRENRDLVPVVRPCF